MTWGFAREYTAVLVESNDMLEKFFRKMGEKVLKRPPSGLGNVATRDKINNDIFLIFTNPPEYTGLGSQPTRINAIFVLGAMRDANSGNTSNSCQCSSRSRASKVRK